MNTILIYIGGALTVAWGIAHLFPTKNVIGGFGDISRDNKRILAMEWINEGAILIFLGTMTILITISGMTEKTILVYGLIIGMLVVLSAISVFTGFKVKFLPFKLCPFIFMASAILIFLGVFILKPNQQNKIESSNTNVMNQKKVTGIGGIFFKTKDPEKMREWYGSHLGLVTTEYGSLFEFRLSDEPEKKGYLQWSPFSENTDYFLPSEKEFMINYRVENLEKLVDQLRESGVTILDEIETYEYGKFVHILDPENNKIELWEPIDSDFTRSYEGQTTK